MYPTGAPDGAAKPVWDSGIDSKTAGAPQGKAAKEALRAVAVRHLWLGVRPGEAMALLGSSKAGKSTVLDVLTGEGEEPSGTCQGSGSGGIDTPLACIWHSRKTRVCSLTVISGVSWWCHTHPFVPFTSHAHR